MSLQAPRLEPGPGIRRRRSIATAFLSIVILALPFMDFPGMGGGAYVKPLALPLACLGLLICVLTEPSGSLRWDRSSKIFVALMVWALASVMVMPWVQEVPGEMKGQTLGGRVVRDMVALVAGFAFWLFVTLAMPNRVIAGRACLTMVKTFWIVLPAAVVQIMVVLTGAVGFRVLDSVFALVRSTQGDTYKKIFGFTPEGSMFADQLLTMYVPFVLAALLLRTSLFRRRLCGLRMEVWMAFGCLALLLFTQSRIGLLAVAFMAVSGFLLVRRVAGRPRRSQLPMLTALVLVTVLAGAVLPSQRIAQFFASFSGVDASVDDGVWSNVTRMGSMAAGVNMAIEHPMGVGTGVFPFAFAQHVPSWALISPEIQALLGLDYDYFMSATGSEGIDIRSRLPDAKSLPVRVLAELGLPGFALLAWFWWTLFRRSWACIKREDDDARAKVISLGILLSLVTMLPLSLSINSYVWVHWIFIAALAAAWTGPSALPGKGRVS